MKNWHNNADLAAIVTIVIIALFTSLSLYIGSI